jgi:tetratricopeptide (TPR) repeat protein
VKTPPTGAADWHREGNALLDEGKLDRAISAFRRALRADDSLAEVHNDLGAVYFRKRWYAEAEECFRKAIERAPEHGVAHANLGAALRALGRNGDSRRAYQRALLLKFKALLPPFLRRKKSGTDPISAQASDSDVLHQRAVAHEDLRDYPGAIAAVREAIARRPDVTDYHITHARLLVRTGGLDAALRAGMAALKLEPGSAKVHATMSGIFHPWREDLAEQAARHAIELDPGLSLGHANLAAALWGQGRLAEAEHAAKEAIRLSPGEVSYRTNLGIILKDLDRLDEVRALYRELIAEAPEHAKVCIDLGTLALEAEGDLKTARAMYRKAQQAADEPRAHMAEALVDLLENRFSAAWPKYEARKQLSDQRGHHDQFASLPDWDGAPLGGGKLLVYGEQGLGDEVMFASMLPEVSERAVLLCDPRLGALFARSFPALEVLAEPRATQGRRAAALDGIRAKIAAGSLGRRLRASAADFPQHRGYLRTDPGKVQPWRERLAGSGAMKVGLSWKGGVQTTGRSRRSIPFAQLELLLSLPGISWISLQHEDDSSDPRILRFAEATRDIDELASLMSALDLVVSVCNTNVHVAGALGKEVLVMAPFVPEWRYGMTGERMIWYPSARVFRQERYGDWNKVLAEVASACSAHLSPGCEAAATFSRHQSGGRTVA